MSGLLVDTDVISELTKDTFDSQIILFLLSMTSCGGPSSSCTNQNLESNFSRQKIDATEFTQRLST